MKLSEKKILLGLTTTPGSNWREKVKEIDRLGLEEIALFPTFLKPFERKELYSLLEKTKLKNILHVHLRDDMTEEEVKYFLNRWKTQVFNIHPYKQFLPFLKEEVFKKIIFVENHTWIKKDFKKMINLCGGICLDFAHWKSRKNNLFNGYWNFEKLIKKYVIGCCHVSAIRKQNRFFWTDDHHFKTLKDFDYLKEFKDYFPELISLELENSFVEQLEVKKYLKKGTLVN